MLPQTILACSSRQPLCFHILADSLSSPKKSTPLESSKSRLFSQNTRGGGYQKNRAFGINNIQALFSDSVCKSVTPAPLPPFSAPRCLPGDPIRSLLFSLCVNSAFSAPRRYPCGALRFCRPCPLQRAFVFTTIRIPCPATFLFSNPYKTPRGAPQVRLPWLPSPILPPTQISPNLPFTRSDVPTSATVRWRSNV